MATVLDTPVTALVPVTDNPNTVVLFDKDAFNTFLAKLKADVEAVPVDLTTDKGRKAIASAAHKVRTEKAGIDRDRKALTQEWRDNTALVNGAWKGIEAEMDALIIAARKPLAEWEEAEAARVAKCESIMEDFKDLAHVSLIDDSISVRERGTKVWETELDPAVFGDRLESAQAAKDGAMATLQAALARLVREEADKAELQRLRDEAAARAEADRVAQEEAARIEAERIATERAAQEAAERAQAEQERRAAAEQAEAARIERAKAEAAEAAQREAEQAAQAERLRVEREHAEQLAAERRRTEQAERDAQAERDRVARDEAERQAEIERAAAEQRAREENQAHRTAIKTAAKEAIIAIGIPEAKAIKLVQAIVAGDIPHVRVEF